MPIDPVVAVLAEEWSAICDLGVELREDEWGLPSECPGWTVRDLVSHMIGTERSILGDPAPPPVPERPPHVHNDIGAANEGWVAARRSLPGAEVLAEFRAVTARRVEQLEGFAPEHFDEVGPSPVGQVPYREFMHVRVMDCWVHEQDMRVATERPGHSDGPAARIAFDRIASAMPFVVARKASAPDGTGVRFTLAGSPARTVEVAVRDGRGALEPCARPDVELAMDAELFWRLGCGRVAGEAALGAGLVGVEGDTELGERIVRSMAFMI